MITGWVKIIFKRGNNYPMIRADKTVIHMKMFCRNRLTFRCNISKVVVCLVVFFYSQVVYKLYEINK